MAYLTPELQHFWHPCAQMKDYETFKPLMINKAKGCYLECADGRRIIDAISSWWCKTLGHQHPRLQQALIEQAMQFEHVILANTTNEVIIKLSRQLAQLLPTLTKVMYASDGACAIDMALKMSIHARSLRGEPQRTKFITLQNSYHGETVGALSVSDVGLYRTPYHALLFEPYIIENIPYVNSVHDPLWHDCGDYGINIIKALEPYADTATAIIVEPIVQGAAGMRIYSAHFLRLLREWSHAHGIHLIADEIMTGLARTGKLLACEHANIKPDFVCLGKGLTAGWLPLSVVLTTDEIYNYFYADYQEGKSFLHSHTFSGNALAARVASETLDILRQQNFCQRAQHLGNDMLTAMQAVAAETGQLTNVRGIGAIVAADLINANRQPRLAYAIYQQAVALGALLRPLGNTLYWFPPLIMDEDILQELQAITITAINNICNNN